MRRLHVRVQQLEDKTLPPGVDVRRWAYWDAYTPAQRAEMEGCVRWIKVNRPGDDMQTAVIDGPQ